MKLKVRMYGDSCLREKCQPVDEVGPSERMLIDAMLSTMHKHKGIGLAAPQVGVNKRFFVVDTGNGPRVFINPEIIGTQGKAIMEEGCLSIPEVHIDVTRPAKVIVRYQDQFGGHKEEAFDDLMARVIQHENDHLDGKLIVDYASEQDMKKYQAKLKSLENQKG